MKVKTTGKVLKAWFADDSEWPPGLWFEEEVVTRNGVEVEDFFDFAHMASDDDIVCVEDGQVFMDHGDYRGSRLGSVAGKLKAWIKRQNVATVLIEINKDRLDDLRAAVEAVGGKVLEK